MVTDDFLLIADAGSLYQLSLAKDFLWRIPLTMQEDIYSIAYDPVEMKVYWTEQKHAIIKRAHLSGSNEETIHQMYTST